MKDLFIKIKMVTVDSSNINGVGYHSKRKIMAVRMNNDTIYNYIDVPKKIYTEMMDCYNNNIDISSIGSYLHRHVKGNYRYVRVQ